MLYHALQEFLYWIREAVKAFEDMIVKMIGASVLVLLDFTRCSRSHVTHPKSASKGYSAMKNTTHFFSEELSSLILWHGPFDFIKVFKVASKISHVSIRGVFKEE